MENNENINKQEKTTMEKIFGTKEEIKVRLKYAAIVLPSMAAGSLLTLGAIMLKNKSANGSEASVDTDTGVEVTEF